MNPILAAAGVPFIGTDAEAERLFGPWGRGLVSAVKRMSPPVAVFTAGVCSRCKAPCVSQMISLTVGAPEKAEALCPGCLGWDVEAKRADWFASEERSRR